MQGWVVKIGKSVRYDFSDELFVGMVLGFSFLVSRYSSIL